MMNLKLARKPQFGLMAILMAASGCCSHPRTNSVTSEKNSVTAGVVRIVINRPTIIQFYPPAWETATGTPDEHSANEAKFHLAAAMQDTMKCLGESDYEYRLEVATRLQVIVDGKTHEFPLKSGSDDDYGAIFAAPGREPRRMRSTHSPSIMIMAMRMDAADYFKAPYKFPWCDPAYDGPEHP